MFWKKKKVKTKGIFVIIDGAGDLDNKILGGKTPLEVAHIPNLDIMATRGKMGYMYTVRPGYAPGSDEAIVSIFGNDLKNSSRGRLEAYGAGVKLREGDLALRVNFATIDSLESGKVIDRRAGRTLTTKEAKILASAINKINFPHKFEFISTIQHRGVLVFRGNYSDKITGDDITYQKGSSQEIKRIAPCTPLKKDEKSRHTAEVLNDFLRKTYEVLKDHPINKERKRKGLLPANYLLVRCPGTTKPRLKQYKNWISTHAMPLEIGFSELSGMKNIPYKYPPLKGLDAYGNLWDGLKKSVKHSIKVIKRNLHKAEYFYIHFKETDLPGHDNKPLEKKAMIEYIDKTFFKFIVRIASAKNIKVLVTADHSTPCKLKAHSDDPVPVLLYDHSIPKEKKHFCEKESRFGTLKRIIGKNLFKKTGFLVR